MNNLQEVNPQQQNGGPMASTSSVTDNAKPSHYGMSSVEWLLEVAGNYAFLDKLKEECTNQPQVYDIFHQYCRDLHLKIIGAELFIKHILELFNNNKNLLSAFKYYIPKPPKIVVATQTQLVVPTTSATPREYKEGMTLRRNPKRSLKGALFSPEDDLKDEEPPAKKRAKKSTARKSTKKTATPHAVQLPKKSCSLS